ncbi:hypothetical protein [Thermosyntropha sp.]|uniref:hypothetical protein n=1 Tax=Thermosyntropha sp. TaxID=2740820 RepID=UPI0026015B95|nr:hypothetical protein [Thermosyntropha sp.]MBO8159725.1 hypothetical protein [Thermosyntropha sp.]
MNYKSWFFSTLFFILLFLCLLGFFNWYIDPLWCFNHSHSYNQVQMPFDERQQKTNYVTFHSFDYNALILGSSRVTYIDQHDFTGMKAYNYGVSNMLLEEYYDYVEYAKKKRGRRFDYIIIGLDFWTTNKNKSLPSPIEKPSFYIKKANSFGYRYKMLFSHDTYQFALKNFKAAQNGTPVNFAYDRNNVKTLLPVTPEEREIKIARTVNTYREKIYRDYEYMPVKEILLRLKKANPDTKFIVFTTPESLPLMQLIEEEGLTPYYERWLYDCVEVFGEVYHFMYPNSVTCNLENYYDASHFYPHIGTMMAHKMLGIEDETIPADFGVKLDKNNLDEKLKEVGFR